MSANPPVRLIDFHSHYSDWPIMPIAARPKVEALRTALNLSATDQAAILSDNTLRLLTRT